VWQESLRSVSDCRTLSTFPLTTILLWLCETPGPSAIDAVIDVSALDNQWPMQKMVSGLQLAIWSASIHISQILLHVAGREHGNILQAERREDVLLEIFVQGHFGDTWDHEMSSQQLSKSAGRSPRFQ
jgi:hypothetical protein